MATSFLTAQTPGLISDLPYWYDSNGNYFDALDFTDGSGTPLQNFLLSDSFNGKSLTSPSGLEVRTPSLGGDTFLGLSNTGWKGLATLGNIGMGLVNAFQAQQQIDMARDQYKFQKNLANRNIANQAKIINNTYDNAGRVAAALSSSGGLVDPTLSRQAASQAKSQYVNGSPI